MAGEFREKEIVKLEITGVGGNKLRKGRIRQTENKK